MGNAASFLAGNLDRDLVAHLDLASLQTIQASFIDSQFAQSEVDLLFSVTLCGGRAGFVYFIFEHQSHPAAFMLLCLLSYMVRVWQRFHHQHPDAERLPAMVPMAAACTPASQRALVIGAAIRSLQNLQRL